MGKSSKEKIHGISGFHKWCTRFRRGSSPSCQLVTIGPQLAQIDAAIVRIVHVDALWH